MKSDTESQSVLGIYKCMQLLPLFLFLFMLMLKLMLKERKVRRYVTRVSTPVRVK